MCYKAECKEPCDDFKKMYCIMRITKEQRDFMMQVLDRECCSICGEIKFRAFIKKLGWVVLVEQINFDVRTVEVDLSSGQGDTSEYDFDEIELMQYTGLEDRECNEIYEGDIVEIEGIRFRIGFEIGSFMLIRCLEETCMYERFTNCWNDDTYPLSQLYWEDNCEEGILDMAEIIGNIFENTELLEGEK